jgi:hypothetical protein
MTAIYHFKGVQNLNYLKEILTFENWVEYNSAVNKSDIRLWYTLMHLANRFNWKEFTIPIATLIFKSKLSKSDIYRARNKLKQLGFLEFTENGKNKSTSYKMKSTVSQFGSHFETPNDTTVDTASGTPDDTASGANVGNYNKTKNLKLETRKKENTEKKNAFGEFKNVLLSKGEFAKLKARFPADCSERIERLSSYIASSGKRYKSHYATILTWAEKDKEVTQNYADYRPYHREKLCTEYPE